MISAIRLFFMLIWTLSLMFFTPFFIPITFNRQFPLFVARTLFSRVLIWIAGVKLKTYGVENVPTDQPLIFIANHCSYIDIGVLCRIAPVNLHFIGKKELMWVPIIGWYMVVAGHIFIDRSNRKKAVESLKKAALKIKNGKCVAMYPEGTRSKAGELGEFKKGAFHLALDAGVCIIPVHIKGTYSLWPATSNTITPGDVTVRIGKPIDSLLYSRKTINSFVAETKMAIEDMSTA
ncbi:MAG: 1-acyl-sn-glycerol-3-phosphate acyltransferase [Flavobacteriales bacterium]|nr:MAG: 1-acyl-sn-glycerol-3-phosphate acyltransferase [Flavobacteriales bacterium]